jgi:HSP20 family protein
MLVRYDPFRDFDRKTSRRQWMPMDAVRHEQRVELRFDVPGIEPDSLDVEVERNVLTVRAERSWTPAEGDEVLAQERPQGSVARQVMLGDALDTERLEATYDAGVLSISIPVAEQAKARKVEIQQGAPQPIEVGSSN